MKRDAGIGVGLLAFCGLLYWQAGLVSAPPFVPIGPAFYPRVILILLAGLALWLIAEDLLRRRAPSRRKQQSRRAPRRITGESFSRFSSFWGMWSASASSAILTATFLFVLGLSWAIGPRNIREMPKLVAIAVGTALVTYLVFEKYLYVFLPQGLLF